MSGHRSRVNLVVGLLLALTLAGSVLTLMKIDRVRGRQATLEDVLYVTSGRTLQKLSLGYRGLLADIYWTRAVQYFGDKHIIEDVHYDLLDPLLNITTDLDPNLLVAYNYGAFFLSQKPPHGAGQPDRAVALLEKGIRFNPDDWHLYFNLGFVDYMDRKDPKAAEDAFRRGAARPDAHPSLRIMAASMAQKASDIDTARALWTELYQTTRDQSIRDSAEQHLAALHVDYDIQELENRVAIFRQRNQRLPADWYDMVRAGLLRGVPADPSGTPYRLMPDGAVYVRNPDDFAFIEKGIPPGWVKKAPRAGKQ
jgi:tetratricopeptide (TPR) repeat protein